MSKPKSQNILITFAATIIAALIASYFLSTTNKSTNTNSDTKESNQTASETSSDESKSNLFYTGKIYYFYSDEKVFNIYSKEDNQNQKLIYTDKNETEKVKYAHSITNDSKILAQIQNNSDPLISSLYLINTDGSGDKEKIVDSFNSSQAPIINPTSDKIAYVIFSNAERDYGYTLYIMSADGTNKVEIDSSEIEISQLSFSSDGQSLAYKKDNEVYILNLEDKQPNKIYTPNDNSQITNLSFNSTNLVLVTINNNDNYYILSIDKNSSDTEKYNIKNQATQSTWADNENTQLFYNTGESIVLLKNDQTKNIVDESINIIKWIQ